MPGAARALGMSFPPGLLFDPTFSPTPPATRIRRLDRDARSATHLACPSTSGSSAHQLTQLRMHPGCLAEGSCPPIVVLTLDPGLVVPGKPDHVSVGL